ENKGDPAPLIDPARYPDAQAIKAHLFNELIPALITKRRPVRDGSDPLRPRRGWEPDQARRWLAYLAVQLRGQRDLRWWHLPSAVPSGVITTLMVLIGVLIAGLVGGLVGGLTERGLVGVGGGVGVGRADGWGLGPVFGLLVGRKVRRTPEPGYANLRLRGRGRALARDLLGGLGRGRGFGLRARVLLCGLGVGLFLLGVEWLTVGLVVALAVRLAGG